MAIKNKAIAAVTCGLSLAMTLGGPLSAIPAYAATVNINQDQAGQAVSGRTFNAYKIATYTVDADGGHIYTFVSDEARTAVRGALTGLGVDLDGVTTDVSLAGKISQLGASDQAQFAKAMAEKLAGPTAINGNTATLDDNAYYVVEETTADDKVVKAAPFLIETETGELDVTLKSSQPNIDKVIVDGKDAKFDDTSIGKDVKFQLNDMTVPNTYGYDSFTYTINDKMSDGLTLTKAQLDDMVVTIGGQTVTASDKTYTVLVKQGDNWVDASTLDSEWTADGAEFQIKFNPNYFIGQYENGAYTQTPKAGSTITVDFAATLNSKAEVVKPESNTTSLTYTNKPGSTTDSTEHKVYVYTFGIEVNKTFSDNKNLFSQVELGITGTNGAIYVIGDNGVYTVCKQGDAGAKDASAGLKLDSNGNFTIKGLDEGTYTVKETKTPDGYKPNGDQTIKITPHYGNDNTDGIAGKTITVDNDANNNGYVDGAIVNSPNTFQLPLTGDAGMFLLPAAGLGIMGVVLVVSSKKKMDKDNE